MPNPVLTEAIDRVASGSDLESDQAAEVLNEIMNGRASEAQTAAFLIALRTKGETVDELVGLAQTMRELSTKVETGRDDLLDTAGTGGGFTTFNVSTTAALIAAAAGVPVAKHGNRSATSLCGSADVLEALGARIELGPEAIAECINAVGFGFMFAPQHHAATRYVVPVRKELAVRTIFNFLGPLTNPAGAAYQIVGVSDPAFLEVIAGALKRLGAKRAMVVSSEDGLDEVSASAPTNVFEVSQEGINSYTLTVEEMGVEAIALDQLAGGSPEQNAAVIQAVLGGEQGPARTFAVVNAAAAIYVAGSAQSLKEGAALAQQVIDSGKAKDTLEGFVAKTKQLS